MAAVRAPQTIVSRHCKILRVAGVIADRRSGKWVNYTLVDRRVIDLLNALKSSA
ncbi:MAG: DNA-binding transcriptional repressor ArsR [Methanocella sp. PtaU1.Bin125]|nr:MAG: DNA-binding transcriptional repressor ArsR [Methanocella sp. PtaU1.Bin125]